MTNHKESLASKVGIYAASGAGAFLIGFGDLLRGGSDSTSVTVLRITEVLRSNFSPSFGQGWVALLFLAAIGCILCFFYQPASRKESFTLGMSVFALLTATTPYHRPSEATDHSISLNPLQILIGDAVAGTDALRVDGGQDRGAVNYYLQLMPAEKTAGPQTVTLSLYNKDESTLLDTRTASANGISKLSLAQGDYVLYVECRDCKRVRVEITIGGKNLAGRVQLESAGVPLSLQRLFRPSNTNLAVLSDAEVDAIKQQYDVQKSER